MTVHSHLRYDIRRISRGCMEIMWFLAGFTSSGNVSTVNVAALGHPISKCNEPTIRRPFRRHETRLATTARVLEPTHRRPFGFTAARKPLYCLGASSGNSVANIDQRSTSIFLIRDIGIGRFQGGRQWRSGRITGHGVTAPNNGNRGRYHQCRAHSRSMLL